MPSSLTQSRGSPFQQSYPQQGIGPHSYTFQGAPSPPHPPHPHYPSPHLIENRTGDENDPTPSPLGSTQQAPQSVPFPVQTGNGQLGASTRMAGTGVHMGASSTMGSPASPPHKGGESLPGNQVNQQTAGSPYLHKHSGNSHSVHVGAHANGVPAPHVHPNDMINQQASPAGTGGSGEHYGPLVLNPLKVRKVHKDPTSLAGSAIRSPRNLYLIVRLLQSAIYGGVFLAHQIHPVTGHHLRKVAVKVMLRELERRNRGTLQEDILAELKFFSHMEGHQNILVFDETWSDQDCVYVVMQHAEYEDLFEVLRKRKQPFSEAEARWLFVQIIDAVLHLHKKGIAFRGRILFRLSTALLTRLNTPPFYINL
eukprot:GHVN01000967.1.p1 GENE.GHVN01000967.1~~GHVN01000967.1.p1  ORF type:complete len:367 (+),score=67.51 GHVN01000967.1:935-2035(+)